MPLLCEIKFDEAEIKIITETNEISGMLYGANESITEERLAEIRKEAVNFRKKQIQGDFDWGCFSDVYKSDNGIRPGEAWTLERAQDYMTRRQEAYKAHEALVAEWPKHQLVENYGVLARVVGYESDSHADLDGCVDWHHYKDEGLRLKTLSGNDEWVAAPKDCIKVEM